MPLDCGGRADWGRARHEAVVAGEGLGAACSVAAAVVGQPPAMIAVRPSSSPPLPWPPPPSSGFDQ